MKSSNTGTFRFTQGLGRTTWRNSLMSMRLLGFSLAVGAVAFLIIWIDSSIWRAQRDLEESFGAIKTEKFYFGVNFRLKLRKLNDSLLDYRLTGQAIDREAFNGDAQALKFELSEKTAHYRAPIQRAAFAKLKTAYNDFLAKVAPLIEASNDGCILPERFAAIFLEVKEDYYPLLKACDEVILAEHAGLNDFLQDSDRSLVSLQRLFMISLLLLVALAGALALLVFRGMLGPLQAQLSESQALIARQEKLASLGVLGTGVAHEIRNPLTAIKFRLFSLKKSLPPEFAKNEDAQTISDEINRLDHIVKDFLQFARPADPELVSIPAERLLQDVREFMSSELETQGIDLQIEVEHSAWILADTYQLKQVLINLIQNAADSIERNGSIKLGLKTNSVALGESRAWVILSVMDSGKGIPLEVQKRLFDPFFTTKDRGTGLGLAIAARIVEKHSGVLRYHTKINYGTTFEIVLPESEVHATDHIAH